MITLLLPLTLSANEWMNQCLVLLCVIPLSAGCHNTCSVSHSYVTKTSACFKGNHINILLVSDMKVNTGFRFVVFLLIAAEFNLVHLGLTLL